MFTKFNLFAAAVVSTLAFSGFSSESAQAGRYRVEGPSSENSGAQVGRFQSKSENRSFENQNASMTSETRVAGRFVPSQAEYAVRAMPESEMMKTQRAPAANVSNHNH